MMSSNKHYKYTRIQSGKREECGEFSRGESQNRKATGGTGMPILGT